MEHGLSPDSHDDRALLVIAGAGSGKTMTLAARVARRVLAGADPQRSQAPLAQVLQETFPWCGAWGDELKALFRGYVAEKQNQHVLAYDDLPLYWQQLMGDSALSLAVGARFDHVLVDEYQDTNRLQASILLALKPDGRGLTVVGDDAQSIYSFRSAELRNILDFPASFAEPARVITLEHYYRSTQPILDASNSVIAQASERFAKQLWTDRASSEKPTLVTVFRASRHSAALELELTRRSIPFVKFGGLKFLETAHVKDVLSVLRWAQNPRSAMAGLRVAQLVPGVGAASAKRLMAAIQQAADPLQALNDFVPPAAAVHDWAAFIALLATLKDAATDWPADIERVNTWYSPHLQPLHDDAPVRQADLDQLARIAAGYASRELFLTELMLDPPDATSDRSGAPHLDEDYVILSTIHSAKGQEWTAVYVLNVVDECIPSDMATGHRAEIEEERRLLYVALTRARHHLHLLVPQRFYVTRQTGRGDRHLYGSLTRFIPEPITHLFERVAPTAQAEPLRLMLSETPTIDISARIKASWA